MRITVEFDTLEELQAFMDFTANRQKQDKELNLDVFEAAKRSQEDAQAEETRIDAPVSLFSAEK